MKFESVQDSIMAVVWNNAWKKVKSKDNKRMSVMWEVQEIYDTVNATIGLDIIKSIREIEIENEFYSIKT